jgi:HAD superfamily hydrolase (TIGR01450 family)
MAERDMPRLRREVWPVIADQFDAFLFDLDGAVYVGEEPTPGAVETLDRLRERGATIRFLTNNPRATRQEVADRLVAMGVGATVAEIVTAGWAAAEYSSEQGARTAAMVGTDGLAAEIEAASLQLVESNPDVVIVGAANDTDYGDVRRAARLIRAGAAFVATNPDAAYPTPDGPAPGTGAIVRAVEVASGVRPTLVGKPDPRMFEVALEGVEADAVVVGDNPETDVLGAHRAGLPAVLVGGRTPPGISEGDFRTPDATVPDLRGLFDPDVTIRRWERPGYDWPEAVLPAVAAIVRDAGRVLLVHGEDGPTFPVGEVERTETVAEAARRVVREQSGLDATPAGLVGVYSGPAEQVVTRADGATVQRVTTCLDCEVLGSDPDGDAAFVDPGTLPSDLNPFAESAIDDVLSDDRPVVR